MTRRRRPSSTSTSSSPHLLTAVFPSPITPQQARTQNQDSNSVTNGLVHAAPPSTGDIESVSPRPRNRRTSSAPPLSPQQDDSHLNDPVENRAVNDKRLLSNLKAASSIAEVKSFVERQSLLLPPQYGRPARPSSPDVFNALFNPVLRSLSRPSSPATRRSREDSSPLLVDSQVSEQQRATSSLPSHFPPRNPTDPAPTVESQGFLLYISSLLLYILYLFWSFLPDRVLDRLGIEWYPSREWALLIPSWITMTVLYVYLGYIFLNMSNTVPLEESLASFDVNPVRLDPKAFVPPPTAPSSLLESLDPGRSSTVLNLDISRLYLDSTLLPPEAIPPLYDLPLDVVNRVLYD